MRSLRWACGLRLLLAPALRASLRSSRRALPLKVATPPCSAAAAARRCGGCAGRCLRVGCAATDTRCLFAACCVNPAPVPVAASGGRERRGRYTGLAPGCRPRPVAWLLVGYGVCAPFGALAVPLRCALAASAYSLLSRSPGSSRLGGARRPAPVATGDARLRVENRTLAARKRPALARLRATARATRAPLDCRAVLRPCAVRLGSSARRGWSRDALSSYALRLRPCGGPALRIARCVCLSAAWLVVGGAGGAVAACRYLVASARVMFVTCRPGLCLRCPRRSYCRPVSHIRPVTPRVRPKAAETASLPYRIALRCCAPCQLTGLHNA